MLSLIHILLSANELKEEIARAEEQIRAEHLGKTRSGNYLFNYLDEDTARRMEDVRLGKDEVKKWN